MKTIIRNTALLGGLILATATFAQTKTAPAQSVTKVSSTNTKTAQEPQATYMFSAEQMTQDLGLSNDQSEKMKSIEADMNKRMMEMEKLDPKERNAKEQSLLAEHNKMVSSVLTKEQNEKLKMMQDEKMKERNAKMEQAVPKETK